MESLEQGSKPWKKKGWKMQRRSKKKKKKKKNHSIKDNMGQIVLPLIQFLKYI